jgi:hypothetical protein
MCIKFDLKINKLDSFGTIECVFAEFKFTHESFTGKQTMSVNDSALLKTIFPQFSGELT